MRTFAGRWTAWAIDFLSTLKGGDSRLSRRFPAWLREGSCFTALRQGMPYGPSYTRARLTRQAVRCRSAAVAGHAGPRSAGP